MPLAPSLTPFAVACDQIGADLIAQTPSSEASIPYVRSEGEDDHYGESGHRSFWFEWLGYETIGARTAALALIEHQFVLRIRFHALSKTVRSMPNDVQGDAIIIQRLINQREVYPAANAAGAVRHVRAYRADISYEGKNAILNLHCGAFTHEVTNP